VEMDIKLRGSLLRHIQPPEIRKEKETNQFRQLI